MIEYTKNFKLLVWSGGYDSTSILMDLIEKHTPFDILCITLANNEVKGKVESEARNKILEILNPQKLLRKIHNFSIDDIRGQSLHLSQPVLWLSSIISCLNDDNDEVLMGYHKGCCAIIGDDMMSITFNSMCELGRMNNIPKLKFPLIGCTKEDILRNWYYNKDYELGRKVRQHIWTCEHPIEKDDVIEKCGKCIPCKTELKTIFLIENFKEKEIEISEN